FLDYPLESGHVVAAAEADDLSLARRRDAPQVEYGPCNRPCARGVVPLGCRASEFDEQRGTPYLRGTVVGTFHAHVVCRWCILGKRADDTRMSVRAGLGERAR